MSDSDFIQIKPTLDGSSTLFLPSLNETYHSLHGAISESLHVYIRHGLDLVQPDKTALKILEIGFGTGLNFLLTLNCLHENVKLEYLTTEPFPIKRETLEPYYQSFSPQPEGIENILGVSELTPGQWHQCSDSVRFYLAKTRIHDLKLPENWLADLVYFDAFAPSRQPEMWTEEVLSKVYVSMNPGGILTTYCAQGQFKRNLKTLGFKVENPQGANGKREMTIAIKT